MNLNENRFKASVGILFELYCPFYNNPPFGHLYEPGTNHFWMPMSWQHFTMYLFFDFYGFFRHLQTSGYQMVQGKFLISSSFGEIQLKILKCWIFEYS